MKQPTYKPEAWVLFQQGNNGGYGQVIGATFDGSAWLYTVTGSRVFGTYTTVREEEIKQVLQNGSWLTVTAASASASAYQDAE